MACCNLIPLQEWSHPCHPLHRGPCHTCQPWLKYFHSSIMGFQRAKEDRPTPPEVYNWKVYAAAIIISLGVLAYGYDSSFIGTTITQPAFRRDFGLLDMTKAEQNAVSSNLTSICTSIHPFIQRESNGYFRFRWWLLRGVLHVLLARASWSLVDACHCRYDLHGRSSAMHRPNQSNWFGLCRAIAYRTWRWRHRCSLSYIRCRILSTSYSWSFDWLL